MMGKVQKNNFTHYKGFDVPRGSYLQGKKSVVSQSFHDLTFINLATFTLLLIQYCFSD
jgi:hypothetical protein